MVQGQGSPDVFDNCDLHPDQCFCCFFGQKEGIFWRKNVFLVESLNFFLRKLTKFSIPQMEKETLILMQNVSHKVYFCNFGYLNFLHFNKNWQRTFLLTSIFTSLFKVAWSINQILLPLLEGRMDKRGFKSHRLPYGQR